jgi:hypothetical protein
VTQSRMTKRTPAPAGSGHKLGELGELLTLELLLFRCTGCSTVRAMLTGSLDDIVLGLQPCVSCGTIDRQDLLHVELDAKGRRVRFSATSRQLLHRA